MTIEKMIIQLQVAKDELHNSILTVRHEAIHSKVQNLSPDIAAEIKELLESTQARIVAILKELK